MSSYYDMYMRCCMQTCDADGYMTGGEDDCFPCPPEYDPFQADPGNPETIEAGESVQLCVIGGVPPYSWNKLSGGCLDAGSGPGSCITVSNNTSECCTGSFEVTDKCGNMVQVGVRGLGGQWILTGDKVCTISGPATSGDKDAATIIQGIHKITEGEKQLFMESGMHNTEESCGEQQTEYDGDCTNRCASSGGCDPVVPCDTDNACIDEVRTPSSKTCDCYESGGKYYSCCEESCLRYRNVYIWECP